MFELFSHKKNKSENEKLDEIDKQMKAFYPNGGEKGHFYKLYKQYNLFNEPKWEYWIPDNAIFIGLDENNNLMFLVPKEMKK